MERQNRKRRKRPGKLFLLHQVLPMRPYLMSLMKDLRAGRLRQNRLRTVSLAGARAAKEPYCVRKVRHDADAEFSQIRKDEQEILKEFKKLMVRVGNVLRGEMLFPCIVDNREAYFIWFNDQPRPTHWRFHGDRATQPIPEQWFHQFVKEKRRRPVEGSR